MKEFFSGYGNIITANTFLEIYKIALIINPKVYQIDYNPTDRERYYILRLLPLYSIYELLTYPITVECLDTGERQNMPDFRITDLKNDYILEATMATTEEYINKSKSFALDGKTYNSYKIEVKNGEATVELYEEEWGGRFIYGFESDKAFAVINSDSIIKKTKKLPKYNIEKEIEKELLLYYNFPGSINLPYALRFLRENLEIKGYYSIKPKFDKVHIQKDNYILYDVLGVGYKQLHIYSLFDYIEHLKKENPSAFDGFPNQSDSLF